MTTIQIVAGGPVIRVSENEERIQIWSSSELQQAGAGAGFDGTPEEFSGIIAPVSDTPATE